MTGTNETRVVNEATGGAKGSKDERYDLLPFTALDEVARLYAAGAKKYDSHNWRKGYAWSLSFASMIRHAKAFWEGEDIDPETGTHHCAAVAFHALALITFSAEHPELDDRPHVLLERARAEQEKALAATAAPDDPSQGRSEAQASSDGNLEGEKLIQRPKVSAVIRRDPQTNAPIVERRPERVCDDVNCVRSHAAGIGSCWYDD